MIDFYSVSENANFRRKTFMSSVVNKKENHLVEIVFDIPADKFKEALNKAFKKNAKKFSIPGFRPGKAPMNIVTKYYGEGVLYDDAIEDIAQSSYTEAIEEHSLEVVSRPEISEVSEIGSDKGIKFSINVTVKPEVKLGKYKGVEAPKGKLDITDDDVLKELDKVRERNSRMVPVEDRAVLTGDTANIDYEGLLEGVPFEGGQGNAYDLRIGSNSFIPGFEEQVIGREIGEEFDVNVTFPEDYHAENLKGKAVVFKAKVNSIKVKELPEADDEFAKDVSEFDTLEEYKASLKEKLIESGQKRIDSEFENEVVKAVVDNSEVEVPEVMIESEVDTMVEEQSNRMKYQGIELEQYLQYMGQDMSAFRENLKVNAANSVKSRLVIEAIGKELNLEITQEDIDSEIESIAKQYKMEKEDIKKQFADDDSYFKQSITVKKTIDFLKSEAKVTDKKEEEVAESEPSEEKKPKAKAKAKPKPKAKKDEKETAEEK